MITRKLEKKIQEQITKFPVVAITGPRQSGKTTLAKKLAPQYKYYNLEDITTKRFATEDPVGFINSIGGPAIIDEIQKIPNLLSQVQVTVDESKQKGQFIITGSESLLLSEKISQSLAGRVANNILLPLSYEELKKTSREIKNLDLQILQGFYPRLYDSNLQPTEFYPEYISTYIERDVRKLENIGNLALFEKFLQLLAGRVGQLINLTSLSNDLGISHTTVEKWISILEASYIVYRLQPFHANLGKRLLKSPKIYFYDTGVLTYLLGIHKTLELVNHFAYGSIFENLVITETYKHIYNNKLHSKLYFYRDSNNVEVDLIIDSGIEKIGLEIKSSQTYSSEFTSGLKTFKNYIGKKFSGGVIYKGNLKQNIHDFEITNINNWSELLEKIK